MHGLWALLLNQFWLTADGHFISLAIYTYIKIIKLL